MNHYERNIIKFGNDVGKAEIENLGQLEFYDNGKTMKLVEKVSIWNPKQFLVAFSESKWKTAFLKRNIKIPLPYGCIVAALRQTIEDFKSYQNLTSLNRRVLVELVESITVYDKEHIHIQYRFDQEIRNVLEYCSSVPAAETEESAV